MATAGARSWRVSAALVAGLALALSGCSGAEPGNETREAAAGGTRPTSTATKTAPPKKVMPRKPAPKDVSAADFAQQKFSRPTVIDNPWFPLRPGMQYVYEGSALDEGERVRRGIVFTVTDLTKEVAGLRVLVAWDQDFDDGVLAESELAFFAQDDDGNVWHLGQYPEEYEDGEIVNAPTWIHGTAGARAGITMKAQPRKGAKAYSQGYAPPPINWVDRARVHQMGVRTCVPTGCYNGVLVTEEFEPDKPNASQLKYYARGVGGVRVGWKGKGEKEREVLQLVKVVKLSPAQMAKVRQQALAQDKRGYRVSKDVYRHTTPAKRLSDQ